jgi:tol-pal system protein YbgF
MSRRQILSALPATLILVAGCATGGGGSSAPAAAPAPAMEAAAPDSHVDDLQKSVTELADRLEVMSDRLQRLETANEAPVRSASSPAPLVERPAVAEVPPSHPQPRGVPPPSTPQSVVSSPRTSAARALGLPAMEDKYRRALTLYGQGKTAEARRAFQDVFDSDPAGELADNALYWMGETFFAAGNYSTALTYYQRVVKEYSDQNKAPDALYKSGVAYEKMGDLQLAKRAFDECIARYPYSTPAASARMELKRIKY